MNTGNEQLIHNLQDIYNGDPWYGEPVRKKLEEITWKQAGFKPHPASNSIAMIVKHMINWRRFALHKLRDNDAFDIDDNSPDNWDTALEIRTESDWQQLLDALQASQDELIHALQAHDTSSLQQQVKGRSYDMAYLARGISGHDVYHLGQIGYIRSLWQKQQNP